MKAGLLSALLNFSEGKAPDYPTESLNENETDWRWIMKPVMPLYEVKYHGKEEWEEISEVDLMQKLHETFDRVTPFIQLMIEGKQVLTPEAVYRLKVQDKAKFST